MLRPVVHAQSSRHLAGATYLAVAQSHIRGALRFSGATYHVVTFVCETAPLARAHTVFSRHNVTSQIGAWHRGPGRSRDGSVTETPRRAPSRLPSRAFLLSSRARRPQAAESRDPPSPPAWRANRPGMRASGDPSTQPLRGFAQGDIRRSVPGTEVRRSVPGTGVRTGAETAPLQQRCGDRCLAPESGNLLREQRGAPA